MAGRGASELRPDDAAKRSWGTRRRPWTRRGPFVVVPVVVALAVPSIAFGFFDAAGTGAGTANAGSFTGPIDHFVLSAASTTPTAGSGDNLTITAVDSHGHTVVGYTGSKSLTFGGAGNAPNGTHPTVTSTSDLAVNFGTAEPIMFSSGVSTVAGSSNGVMMLFNLD